METFFPAFGLKLKHQLSLILSLLASGLEFSYWPSWSSGLQTHMELNHQPSRVSCLPIHPTDRSQDLPNSTMHETSPYNKHDSMCLSISMYLSLSYTDTDRYKYIVLVLFLQSPLINTPCTIESHVVKILQPDRFRWGALTEVCPNWMFVPPCFHALPESLSCGLSVCLAISLDFYPWINSRYNRTTDLKHICLLAFAFLLFLKPNATVWTNPG